MGGDLEVALRKLLTEVVREVVQDELRRSAVAGSEARERGEPEQHMLLRPSEAAKRLAICERTLYTLTQTGQIPSVRIGRLVRYSPNAIQDWIAHSEAGPEGRCDSKPKAPPKNFASSSGRQASRRQRTEPTKRSPKSKTARASLRSRSSQTPTPSSREQQTTPAGCPEFEPRSIVAFFAERLGVDESTLPRMTNGDVQRIAEIDIPTLHGWTYRGRELPDAAIEKLRDYFVAYLERS